MATLRIVFLWSLRWAFACGDCYRPPAEEQPEFLLTKRAHDVLATSSLPAQFDWSLVGGRSYLTSVRNQQLPRLCGSCWAFASMTALSQRLALQGRSSPVELAPQALLDLSDIAPFAGGCNGGDQSKAYEFVRLNGISDESCAPYQGVEVSTWGEDVPTSSRMCRVCDWNGTCRFTSAGPRWGVLEHGRVLGEEQMKAEIRLRGPIACSIHAKGTAFNTWDGHPEVITDDGHYNTTTHAIVIHGWGVTKAGTPYWSGQNSYGTSWGRSGLFLLRRGSDDLGIESHNCSWAVPYQRSGWPASQGGGADEAAADSSGTAWPLLQHLVV